MKKINFGEVLSRLKQVANVRFQYEIAELLGMSKVQFATQKSRGKLPKIEIELWAVKNGISPEWILTGTGPMKAEQSLSDMGMVLTARYAPGDPRAKGAAQLRTHFTPIPKVTGFLSGGPGSWELSPEVEQYYAFRTDWLKSKGQPAHMKLMQVKGDSMYPTLQNGDYVLVDESQTTPLDGRIMALNLSGEAVVKRIRIELDGRISVLSDSGEVRGPCKPDEITILGKVVWLGREM